MQRQVLDELISGETRSITFPFADRMSTGETIVSCGVTATVHSGTDPTPAAVIVGTPAISGTNVTAQVTSSLPGTVYGLTAGATTSTGQVLKKQAYLTIVSAAV